MWIQSVSAKTESGICIRNKKEEAESRPNSNYWRKAITLIGFKNSSNNINVSDSFL